MRKLALLASVMIAALGFCGCAGKQLPECAQYPPDMDYARVVAVEQRSTRWVVELDWHGYRTDIVVPDQETAMKAFPPVSDSILMTFVESSDNPDYTSVIYFVDCLDCTRRRVAFFCNRQ